MEGKTSFFFLWRRPNDFDGLTWPTRIPIFYGVSTSPVGGVGGGQQRRRRRRPAVAMRDVVVHAVVVSAASHERKYH